MGKILVCEICHKLECSGKLYKIINKIDNPIVCISQTIISKAKQTKGLRMTYIHRGGGYNRWEEVQDVTEKRRSGKWRWA